MAKTIRPMERIEQADKLWSWFERLGLVKTMLGGAVGGGVFTYIVSRFQHFPRWLILGLVFVVSSFLVVLVFAGVIWIISFVRKQIRELVSDSPLRKRVIALEQSIGPRRISEVQRKYLVGELSKQPGNIKISAINPDEDAAQYAEQFAELFRESGWNVWGVERPYTSSFGSNDIGLTLQTTPVEGAGLTPYRPAQNFADALDAVNISIHYYTSFELVRDSCELIVGHRGQTAY